MSNVLNEEKQQQVIALGRLGWSLRRIEQRTGVRRETASTYLKAVGITVRGPGGWGTTAASRATESSLEVSKSKPANEVTTDSGGQTPENRQPHSSNASPSASACEPYRETIELGLNRARNVTAIWQDLDAAALILGQLWMRFLPRFIGFSKCDRCGPNNLSLVHINLWR